MNDNRRMASRLLSFAVWAVVLASALFWGLKVFVPRTPVPPQAQTPVRTLHAGGEMTRLLGVSAAPAEEDEDEPAAESERFRLLGVVAPRGASHSAQGVALISVDNQPARAWRTGATLADDVVLLAVDKRSVKLGPRGGPASTELSLPDPDEAHASTPGQPGVPGRMPGIGGQVGAVLNGAQPVPRPGVVQPQRPGGVQQAGQPDQGDDEDEDE